MPRILQRWNFPIIKRFQNFLVARISKEELKWSDVIVVLEGSLPDIDSDTIRITGDSKPVLWEFLKKADHSLTIFKNGIPLRTTVATLTPTPSGKFLQRYNQDTLDHYKVNDIEDRFKLLKIYEVI